MGVIYAIANKKNGKQYVGKSKNHKNRWYNHGSENTLISQAIREDGKSNFDFEVIQECDNSEMNDLESYYIAFLDTLVPNGYNISPGGTQIAEESKKKMSEAHKGKKISEDTKEKLRIINTGKKMPPEAIERTRLSKVGVARSEETKEKIRKTNSTPEAIERSRLANLGVKRSDEVRANMSKAQLGNKHSEETKKKMSKTRTQHKVLQIHPDGTETLFDSIRDAEAKLGIRYTYINRVCRGERKQYNGFIFKYVHNEYNSNTSLTAGCL